MAKQMKPAATIYLQEFAVLEETRNELHRDLDDLWTKIWEDAEPQLEELAGPGCYPHLWSNKENKGTYVIKKLPKTGVKTTKGNLKTGDTSRPQIKICDPRTSDTPGNYHVQLTLAQTAQSKIKKQLGDAPKKMEQLLRQQGFTGPMNWKSGTLWSKTISIKPDNLDKTESAVVETMCKLFSVIAQFDKWQKKARQS